MNEAVANKETRAYGKGLKYTFRRPLETLLTRLGFVLIAPLPRGAVNALARLAGACVYWFSSRTRAIGLTNLDLVYGDTKTPAEKKRILKTSVFNFVRSTLDLFWFSRNTEKRCARYVSFDDTFTKLLNNDPALCLTGHLGNWEVMGIAFASRGHIIMSVAAPLKNTAVDELFIREREKTGQVIIPQQGAIRKILKGLKEGGKMAVLLDQNTRLRDGGQFIHFAGKQVPVTFAPAAIAIKANAPIHAVYCLPDARGHYTASSPHEVCYDADVTPEQLTQQMSDAFAEAIFAHPECWLWSYKRFKFIPDGADPKDYPAYSEPAR